MKDKNKLMRNLMLGGGAFGYSILSYASGNIQMVFFIFMMLAAIVFFIECIKRKYGKFNIIMAIFAFLLGLDGLAMNLIDSRYEDYWLISTISIIFAMMIVGGINYYKNGNKRQKRFVVIFGVFMTLIIVFLIVGTIMEKYGMAPN